MTERGRSVTAFALDVGGSHVTAGLVDLATRRVIRSSRRYVPHTAALDDVLDAWADTLHDAAQGDVVVSHVGIAVPSPFDARTGTSSMTHKFPSLYGRPLRPALGERLAARGLPTVPIVFGNDADLFALGEWWAGAGARAERVLGITLGTGLGSGFIERGEVVTSGPGVPPHGELWNQPFRGGLAEDGASGRALEALWLAGTGQALPASALAALAREGNVGAREVFESFGSTLAEVLAPWVARFGAHVLILGGNVSRASDLFAPALRAALPGCDVRQSRHFERAALFGAAALRPPA